MSSRSDGDVARRWLAALQALAGNVAHEMRNALNGVAVNLEVVRSRSAREGVAASTLGSYAASASDQLEQVIAMTDALMSLARAQDGAVAIGRTADRVATLVRPPLVAAGGSLELVVEGDGTTVVSAEAARLFVAVVLQLAMESAKANKGAGGVALTCRVRPADGVELQVEGAFGTPPRIESEVGELAKAQGVGIRATESNITLTFPA